MNQKWLKSKGVTLGEALVVIAIIAILTVLLMTRIGGSLERAKDLEVQRDFKKYEDAATALLPTNSDFTKDNINKFIDNALKLSSGDKSNGLNPYDSNYRLIVENKDKFKVESDKYRNGSIIETVTLTITRTNGKISSETTIKENSGGSPALPTGPQPPPANVTDYYTFKYIDGGYEVGLVTGFENALNTNTPYRDWMPGTPLPNPGSMYNELPVISMSNLFYGCKADTLDLSYFNTSNIIDMSYMFLSSESKTLDLSSFNTSNVVNMMGMFESSEITTLDISNFVTSKVTNMSYMFFYTFAQLDLSSFDTSSVTTMEEMFSDHNAETINVSNFDTSNVTNMEGMFAYTEALTLDLSNFDTSKVTNMSTMFCDALATDINISSFKTNSVVDMSYMFSGSYETTLDLSKFDTVNVTDMTGMFENYQGTTLDITNFNTCNVTKMKRMFRYAETTTLDLSNFDMGNVTDTTWMFWDSLATTGYARTLVDATILNASSNKPTGLVFIVK